MGGPSSLCRFLMDLFSENRRNRGLAFEDFPEEEAQKAARDATGANAVHAPSLAPGSLHPSRS
jgi:hypothetical protein